MSRIDDIFNNSVQHENPDECVTAGVEQDAFRFSLVMSVKYKRDRPDVMRKYFRKFRRIFEMTPEVTNFSLLEVCRPNFSSENFVKMFEWRQEARTGCDTVPYSDDELIDYIEQQLSGEVYLKPSVTYGFNWQWTTPERAFLFIAALADVLVDQYSDKQEVPAFNLYKDGFLNVIIWNEIDHLHTLINPRSDYKKYPTILNTSLRDTLARVWSLLSDIPYDTVDYEKIAEDLVRRYTFRAKHFSQICRYWHPSAPKRFETKYSVLEVIATERIYKNGDDKHWTVSLFSETRCEILLKLLWMYRVLKCIESSHKNRMFRFKKKVLSLAVDFEKLEYLLGFFEEWVTLMPADNDTYDNQTDERKVAVVADKFGEMLIEKYGSLKQMRIDGPMSGQEMMDADQTACKVMGEIFAGMKAFEPENR